MDATETSPFPILREPNIDDETSSANTEDHLISARVSSETISSTHRDGDTCCGFEKKRRKWKPKYTLFCGCLLVLIGLISIVLTPFDIFMAERLRMRPEFPPYAWWKNPPDEVLLRVYIFNITNSEEFLSGEHPKLRIEEIGPIVYLEKLTHSNVSFNDNDTLSYVAKRSAIYLPHMNHIDLNQTIYVPNLAVLGMASYLWDASFFTKFAFNLMYRNARSQAIVPTSIKDFLWNFSDPILNVAQSIAPSMVPTKNMGILTRVYNNFEDLVTVYIGPNNGHKNFFLIDKYDGSEHLPGWGSACADKVVNGTEGVTYAQFLTTDSVLFYWRKTICKVTPLHYNETMSKYGMQAFRFILRNNTFHRTEPSHLDCYRGLPTLPNGLSDVSKCYFDFPMAASFPHFLHGDEILSSYVDGLTPSAAKHESFVIVEPITGIPMESRARSQSNLIVKPLSGFNEDINKFGNTVVPLFWLEYNQVGLPLYISALMYFTVVILPHLQKVISALMTIVGLIFVIKFAIRRQRNKRSARLMRNKALNFNRHFFEKK